MGLVSLSLAFAVHVKALMVYLTGWTSTTADPVDMGESIGMSGRFELVSDTDNHSLYRERLRSNWGIVDVNDSVTAAEQLSARGLIDGKRVAIRGGSAGGYTVLAAVVTHPLAFTGTPLIFPPSSLKTSVYHCTLFQWQLRRMAFRTWPYLRPTLISSNHGTSRS